MCYLHKGNNKYADICTPVQADLSLSGDRGLGAILDFRKLCAIIYLKQPSPL